MESLGVTLGESLPPKIAEAFHGEDVPNDNPTLYQRDKHRLTITVPEQLIRRDTPTEMLKKGVEGSINHDLQLGLKENIHYNRMKRNNNRVIRGSLIGGPFVGEAVAFGLTNTDGVLAVIERALEGGVAGIVTAAAALIIKGLVEPDFEPRARKRAEEGRPVQGDDFNDLITKLGSRYFKEPIITLAEATPEK